MHILVVNDDGPPSNQASPYVHSLVSALQAAGHLVSVILPHVQRSWIGKAHLVGHTVTPTYYRPGNILEDDTGVESPRPFGDSGEEWVLVDGTPASCVQIGLYHLFKDRGPVDLVLCGPNFGRNTTAAFALSSGTIGGAMEGAICGKKAIGLSYAYDSRVHDKLIVEKASKLSTRLIEKLVKEWPHDVHLYSINVPVREGVEKTKIVYTNMWQNTWVGPSPYTVVETEEELDPDEEEIKIREGVAQEANGDAEAQFSKKSHKFKWAPNLEPMKESAKNAREGDGWAVVQGLVSVTPLRANFWHLPHYEGEIKLAPSASNRSSLDTKVSLRPSFYAIVDYPDVYVQPLLLSALQHLPCEMISTIRGLPTPESPLLQFTSYESIDFSHVLAHSHTSLANAYVIRKALIRKHYLSNTISTWLVKHPHSCLRAHFKACVHFELDYAEFLDDALVDAWDLNESLARNETAQVEGAECKEWWILKPGMSDGGNGIRLFSSLEELSQVFQEWEGSEAEESDEDEGEGEDNVAKREEKGTTKGESDIMTSQLRHFVAQPYIQKPLLISSKGNRKFHVRTYVLIVGGLRVYVYRDMLALFAAEKYTAPGSGPEDVNTQLPRHLTNTCYQDESTKTASVVKFWALEHERTDSTQDWREMVFSQICDITGEVFEAAAREQMVHFQTLPNSFEIFGADFLVDADLNVWLLELNAFPDFRQTGEDLRDVVGGLMEDVVRVAVKPFFEILGEDEKTEGTAKLMIVKDIDLGRR